jgi:hypothetical protein
MNAFNRMCIEVEKAAITEQIGARWWWRLWRRLWRRRT